MPEPWRGGGHPSGHPESRAAGHPGAAEDWAAGGAAGDDAEERDGQWCLPVSALRGDVGIPGQLLCILQRLPEGLEEVRGLVLQRAPQVHLAPENPWPG